jgi:hypothetical protein
MKSIQLTPQSHESYEIGVDEIVGLKKAMAEVMLPVIQTIKDKAYWNDDVLSWAEYKRRDGFIPHPHNLGGLEIRLVVPDCEQYEFSFLEFGEWDGEHVSDCTDHETCECMYANDGEYDASLRVWLKLESIDDGTLKFWLYMGGGNGDAPYFRSKYETDIFEASFECKSVAGLKRAANKHVKALLEVIK